MVQALKDNAETIRMLEKHNLVNFITGYFRLNSDIVNDKKNKQVYWTKVVFGGQCPPYGSPLLRVL